ncbi:hypothetical protein QR680_007599 [Steinernema hermaphroditum]|uniref:Arginyl-tRNA--protein transferase 1 n=1 Tax=Steinernema hermaphroditum TaxID=289476 RepID=A0AA39IG57_9BILA|nr:hypothetical protein QR680_007599 [Steinernema hermaphroditum]
MFFAQPRKFEKIKPRMSTPLHGSRSRTRSSIVELFDSSTSASTCGYCKGKKAIDGRQKENRGAQGDGDSSDSEYAETSIALGMWGHQLTVDAYLGLMNCGWRRSGRYLYKPIMSKTCCPQYTIRLDVTKVRLSRMQKRVLRNMNRFLVEDKKPSRKEIEEARTGENGCSEVAQIGSENGCPKEEPKECDTAEEKREKSIADYEQPVKKKEMRRRRCFEKLARKGIDVEEFKRQRAAKEESRKRNITSFILPYEEGHKHKLEVRLVREGSPEFADRYDEEVDLYLKYQTQIHKDRRATRRGFEGFLANSPLVYEPGDDDFPGFGSFHQLYILDDKIIAVGVIDLLPACLSSKYFFYDPDFSFLALGTYSALREIEFTQRMNVQRPEVQYYYMGYYLEECPKMKYKGRFKPSFLMCDKTFKWMPIQEAIAMINANGNHFTEFYPNDDRPPAGSFDDIRVICKDPSTMSQRLVTARMYKLLVADDDTFEDTINEFCDLAGPVAAQICIYRTPGHVVENT